MAEYGLGSRNRKYRQPLGALAPALGRRTAPGLLQQDGLRMAATGYLPSVRLGRLVRFKAGDVIQFVETHAENPQTAHHSVCSCCRSRKQLRPDAAPRWARRSRQWPPRFVTKRLQAPGAGSATSPLGIREKSRDNAKRWVTARSYSRR